MRSLDGLLALLLTLAACAQETTSPQGASAITRVVPVAMPDVWCPVNRAPEDVAHVSDLPACHTTADVPPPPQTAARDSMWRTMTGTLLVAGDSVPPASDTIQ
jgi:hypothetical protein